MSNLSKPEMKLNGINVARCICNADDSYSHHDLSLALYSRFHINFEDFCVLIDALLPLCKSVSLFSNGTLTQGFSFKHIWLAKIEGRANHA